MRVSATGTLVAFVLSSLACGGPPTDESARPLTESVSQDLSSSCTGLVPSATTPTSTITTGAGGEGICFSADTDLSSDLATGVYEPTADAASYRVTTLSGTQLGMFGGNKLIDLLPQRWGWMGIGSGGSWAWLDAFDGHGALLHHTVLTTTGEPATAALDLGGGVSVVKAQVVSSPIYSITLQRYSSSGVARAAPVLAGYSLGAPLLAAGVNLSSATLVIWQLGIGDYWQAIWLDRNGVALTSEFTAFHASGYPELVLQPLFDNSVALRIDGTWTARYRQGDTTAYPAPDFLASRPHSLVRLLGSSMVTWQDGSSPSCSNAVDVFAPAGNFCGSVTLAAPVCHAGALSVGRDGSALQVVQVPASSPPYSCNTSVWAHAFH